MTKLRSDVVLRRLDDGAVLVDLDTNNIFELNATGARICELLATPTSNDDIVARLCEEFDVDADLAEGQLRALVTDLEAEGLLSR